VPKKKEGPLSPATSRPAKKLGKTTGSKGCCGKNHRSRCSGSPSFCKSTRPYSTSLADGDPSWLGSNSKVVSFLSSFLIVACAFPYLPTTLPYHAACAQQRAAFRDPKSLFPSTKRVHRQHHLPYQRSFDSSSSAVSNHITPLFRHPIVLVGQD